MSKEQLSNELLSLENEIKILEAKARKRALNEDAVRAIDEFFTDDFLIGKGLVNKVLSPNVVRAKLLYMLQAGLDPFTYFMDIHNTVYCIQGKFMLNKRLIAYQFTSRGGVLKFLERTPDVCRIKATAYASGERVEYVVEKKMQEYKEFADRPVWKDHPETMLSYQCLSEVKRLFSFLWGGVCYTDDEFKIDLEGSKEELGVNQEDLKYDCLKNSESNLISIDNFREAREVENEKPCPKQYDSNQQIIKEGLEGLSRLK